MAKSKEEKAAEKAAKAAAKEAAKGEGKAPEPKVKEKKQPPKTGRATDVEIIAVGCKNMKKGKHYFVSQSTADFLVKKELASLA